MSGIPAQNRSEPGRALLGAHPEGHADGLAVAPHKGRRRFFDAVLARDRASGCRYSRGGFGHPPTSHSIRSRVAQSERRFTPSRMQKHDKPLDFEGGILHHTGLFCPSSCCSPSTSPFTHHRPAVRRLSHSCLFAPTGRRLTRRTRPLLVRSVGAAGNCRRKPLKRDHSGRYPTPRCGAAPAGRGIREGGTQEQVYG